VSSAFPFLVASTILLFLFSDLGLGTVVNVVFSASGQDSVTVGPAFSFSVLTLSRDSLVGGAYMLTILIVGLSGVWPFVKLGLLLLAWLGTQRWIRTRDRSRLLMFLDEYGKYSLVDSWLAVVALCSYDLSWKGQGTSIVVDAVPKMPFFTFVIASVLSLVLGHIATECNRRSLESPKASESSNVPSALSFGPLYEDLRQGQPLLLAAGVGMTALCIVGASFLTSLQMQVSGAIADILLKEEDKTLPYSLISLGQFLTSREANPPAGLVAVQFIFYVFTLVIPTMLMLALLALLLLPLGRQSQIQLLKACRILDAWAAFDVFVIAVTVANFEFWLLAKFLVYNDNISWVCNWVHDNLHVECLAMECHVQPGFALMVVAGVASYLLPKRVFAACQDVLGNDHEVQDSSDSEEEKFFE